MAGLRCIRKGNLGFGEMQLLSWVPRKKITPNPGSKYKTITQPGLSFRAGGMTNPVATFAHFSWNWLDGWLG